MAESLEVGPRRFHFFSSKSSAESAGTASAGAFLVGAVMLAVGGLAGWSLHGWSPSLSGVSPGPTAAAAMISPPAATLAPAPVPAPVLVPTPAAAPAPPQVKVDSEAGRARNVMLAKLDVESYEAQVSQAQDALATAQSQHEVAKLESAAAIAAAKARQELAQRNYERCMDLAKHKAATQVELDNAQVLLQVGKADMDMAQSKLLCVKALEAMIIQREADVKVFQAKLKIAQAELEIARAK